MIFMDQYIKSKLIESGMDVNRSIKEFFFGSESSFEETLKNYPTKVNLFNEVYDAIEKNDAGRAFDISYQLQIQLSFLCFDVVYNKITRAMDKFRKGSVFGTKNYFDQIRNRYHDFFIIVKEIKGEI